MRTILLGNNSPIQLNWSSQFQRHFTRISLILNNSFLLQYLVPVVCSKCKAQQCIEHIIPMWMIFTDALAWNSWNSSNQGHPSESDGSRRSCSSKLSLAFFWCLLICCCASPKSAEPDLTSDVDREWRGSGLETGMMCFLTNKSSHRHRLLPNREWKLETHPIREWVIIASGWGHVRPNLSLSTEISRASSFIESVETLLFLCFSKIFFCLKSYERWLPGTFQSNLHIDMSLRREQGVFFVCLTLVFLSNVSRIDSADWLFTWILSLIVALLLGPLLLAFCFLACKVWSVIFVSRVMIWNNTYLTDIIE